MLSKFQIDKKLKTFIGFQSKGLKGQGIFISQKKERLDK